MNWFLCLACDTQNGCLKIKCTFFFLFFPKKRRKNKVKRSFHLTSKLCYLKTVTNFYCKLVLHLDSDDNDVNLNWIDYLSEALNRVHNLKRDQEHRHWFKIQWWSIKFFYEFVNAVIKCGTSIYKGASDKNDVVCRYFHSLSIFKLAFVCHLKTLLDFAVIKKNVFNRNFKHIVLSVWNVIFKRGEQTLNLKNKTDKHNIRIVIVYIKSGIEIALI